MGEEARVVSPATITRLDDHRPMTGPADWPAVRDHCSRGEWWAAAADARGDADALAYVEARKAADLAVLVAAWRDRKEHL